MKENIRSEKGITLIALVITIIVLLILAGVSIAMLTGENGILTQARNAKDRTEEARVDEENRISDYEDYISQYANGGYVESKGVNAPVLKDGMELVTYNEETGEWEENNSSSAYDYVAGEDSEDNNKSKWANARVTIDGVDSYFVWIPRYAYKITYNNPENKSEGGTIDVKFLVGTSDDYYDENGNLQKAQRAVTGHEDTTSDYFVHPEFTNNVDLGGWNSELTGIWVGKYETSLVDTSDKENIINVVTDDEISGNILLSDVENRAIAVQEGMSSWRNCTIGNMYTNAKSYAENLSSHMLKNSEWGAVAYLTHSQYGRNGGKVLRSGEDNFLKFITADKGISVNPEQSTTKNEYGIYDTAGGGYEYVASWYGKSTSSDWANYGKNLIDEKEKEFITIYSGETESIDYKIGDATYETKEWSMNGQSVAYFVNSYSPVFIRGGTGGSTSTFAYDRDYGKINNSFSFRMCLAI